MGNIFKKESKKEKEYIKMIKEIDLDGEYVNNDLPVKDVEVIRCLKEIIEELEELQKKDGQRLHFTQPKLDMCIFSLL